MIGVYSYITSEAATMIALLNEYFKEEGIRGCAFILKTEEEIKAFQSLSDNEIVLVHKADRNVEDDLIDKIKFDYVFFNDGKAYDMQKFAQRVVKSLAV
jgi:hypothetical protein